MRSTHDPGRVAGFWYLLIILAGPLRLIYIPNKLFVQGDASATVNNIANHEWLFRLGMLSELIGAVLLIFLTLALYRLFVDVNQSLAVQVVIFGGLMPALLYFVNVTTDAGALMIVRGANFLSAFDKQQQNAMAMLLLRLHSHQFTATLLLAGIWLFPLGTLVYRSRFLPRFLAVWLVVGGIGWVTLCFTAYLAPQYQDQEFAIFQPAFFGEIAFMLWLVVKGARPHPLTKNAMAPFG